jgi:hypothetical protein
MPATIKTRNAALFDDWHTCIAYLPKGTAVTVSNNNPAYLGLWADKEYVQVQWNGQTGYVPKDALEEG